MRRLVFPAIPVAVFIFLAIPAKALTQDRSSEVEELRARTSENQEANRLFLLANALLNRRTEETVAQAVEHYTEAVRLDTTFAEAWAMLAQARVVQYSWSAWEVDVPRDSLVGVARTAINRALALDSLCATAWSVVGMMAGWEDRDLPRTRTSFERALAIDSLNPTVLYQYGAALGTDRFNDLERSEDLLRRSLALEPDQPNAWRHLALVLRNQGRLVESEAVLDTLIALGPWSTAYSDRAYVRYLRGDGVGALADRTEVERLGGETPPLLRALFSIAAGDSLQAQTWLEQNYGHEASRADSNVTIAFNIALGRLEEALILLQGLPRDLSMWARLHDPAYEPLHDDPRYQQLLEESRPEGW